MTSDHPGLTGGMISACSLLCLSLSLSLLVVYRYQSPSACVTVLIVEGIEHLLILSRKARHGAVRRAAARIIIIGIVKLFEYRSVAGHSDALEAAERLAYSTRAFCLAGVERLLLP